MTYTEINALQFDESTVYILLSRIFDLNGIIDNEQPLYQVSYEVPEDSFYDRLTLHSELSKPTLQTFQTELDLYKVELTSIEDARLAEVARIQDIKDRFNAIKSIHRVFQSCGKTQPNSALELKRIIDENDQDTLTNYEIAYIPIKDEEDRKERLANLAKVGEKDRNICQKVLSIIGGFNRDKALTKEEIDSMVVTFGSALNALNLNRPDTAKQLISEITPDGVLLTAQDISDILFIFQDNGY